MAKSYSKHLTNPAEKKAMEKLEAQLSAIKKDTGTPVKDNEMPQSIPTLKAVQKTSKEGVENAKRAKNEAKDNLATARYNNRWNIDAIGTGHKARKAKEALKKAVKTAKKAYKSSKEALKKAIEKNETINKALQAAKENYKALKEDLDKKNTSIKQQLATQRFIKTAKKVLAKLPPSELNSDKFKDVAAFIATHDKSGISLSNPLPKVPSELSLKVNEKAVKLGIKTTARVISGVAKTAIKLYGQSSNLGVTILAWATKNAAKPGFLNSLKEFLKDTNSPIYRFLLQAALYVQQHVANRQHTNGNSTHTTSRRGPSMFPSLQPKPALLGPDRDDGR